MLIYVHLTLCLLLMTETNNIFNIFGLSFPTYETQEKTSSQEKTLPV